MSGSIAQRLYVTAGQWEQMCSEAEHKLPEECCGLLAGQGRHTRAVFPITNSLHSPARFLMDAQEQVDAFLEIEQQGLELLAIYHSHPAGPEHPSPTDLAEFYYPGVIYLIWFRHQNHWSCQGYLIEGSKFQRVKVYVNPD